MLTRRKWGLARTSRGAQQSRKRTLRQCRLRFQEHVSCHLKRLQVQMLYRRPPRCLSLLLLICLGLLLKMLTPPLSRLLLVLYHRSQSRRCESRQVLGRSRLWSSQVLLSLSSPLSHVHALIQNSLIHFHYQVPSRSRRVKKILMKP